MDAFDKAKKQIVTDLETPSFSGTYTGFTEAASANKHAASSLNIDKLHEIMQEFRRMAAEHPYPKELWFVKQESAYKQFRDAFPAERGDRAPLWGLSVFIWDDDRHKDLRAPLGFVERIPFYGMVPGIWLKLSDGRLAKVEDVSFLIDAYRALAAGDNPG